MSVETALGAAFLDGSKCYRVLDGYLPPKHGDSFLKLDNTYSAILWSSNGDVDISARKIAFNNAYSCAERDAGAFVAVHKYAPDLAYCCVAQIDERLRGKMVRVEQAADVPATALSHAHAARVTDVKDCLRDPSKEPLWKTHFVRKTRTPAENVRTEPNQS